MNDHKLSTTKNHIDKIKVPIISGMAEKVQGWQKKDAKKWGAMTDEQKHKMFSHGLENASKHHFYTTKTALTWSPPCVLNPSLKQAIDLLEKLMPAPKEAPKEEVIKGIDLKADEEVSKLWYEKTDYLYLYCNMDVKRRPLEKWMQKQLAPDTDYKTLFTINVIREAKHTTSKKPILVRSQCVDEKLITKYCKVLREVLIQPIRANPDEDPPYYLVEWDQYALQKARDVYDELLNPEEHPDYHRLVNDATEGEMFVEGVFKDDVLLVYGR